MREGCFPFTPRYAQVALANARASDTRRRSLLWRCAASAYNPVSLDIEKSYGVLAKEER